MVSVISLLLALTVTGCSAGATATMPDPDPSPDLTPQEVIQLQVEALQVGDDEGIETAFRFASPGNRATTGPLDRFTRMVREGYGDMLGFERAEFGRMVVEGDEAVQRVTLIQPDGRRTAYLFALSKQSGGPYADCWMTDAVMPVPPEDNGLIRT
ncbi:MAG: DUF4864 domain-containing protein [Bacteroidota bacterium]